MPQIERTAAPQSGSAQPRTDWKPDHADNPVAALQGMIHQHFSALPYPSLREMDAVAERAERLDAAIATLSRLAGPLLFGGVLAAALMLALA